MNLQGTTEKLVAHDVNLENARFTDCNIEGLIINGIAIKELIDKGA